MKRQLAFIHTSHAAIPPLIQHYSVAVPDCEITNLLDEGILRFFSAGNYAAAEWRFRDLISVARNAYRTEVAVITCSSAPRSLVAKLQAESSIPVVKIDIPMTRRAVRMGRRIGVALTFQATQAPTTEALAAAAEEAGAAVEIVPAMAEEAYEALLNGRTERHDALVLAAVDRLVEQNVDVVVLAQVSMARIVPALQGRFSVPVLSSVETSVAAVREALASVQPAVP